MLVVSVLTDSQPIGVARYCRMHSAHNWHTALVSERTFRVRPKTFSCISNKPVFGQLPYWTNWT